MFVIRPAASEHDHKASRETVAGAALKALAQKHPEGRDNKPKLGREKPGEGLDAGVDTGAIQPGQSGDASPLD